MIKSREVPAIQIGIMSAVEIRFALHGEYDDSENLKFDEGVYTARMKEGQVVVEKEGIANRFSGKLWLQPRHPETAGFTVFDVVIGINFHWQKKEDQVFRGAIRLQESSAGITLVNILPVEDYLISVISSEMSATSSLELLKAHAVISRSWLLAQIEKEKVVRGQEGNYQSAYYNEEEIALWYDREDHSGFDVCADDHCQRYQGITRASTPVVETAVKETAGEVLMYEDNLCDTRFSKCCGGFSELFENTWEPVNHPYLQRVYDNGDETAFAGTDLTREESARAWILSDAPAFCNTTDKKVLAQVLNDYDQTTHDFYRWKVSFTCDELGDLIKSKTGIDFGAIQDLVPVQRGVSGRLMRLKIVGSKKTMIIGKELEIRKALSKTHLYSSAFVVEKVEGEGPCVFILHGAGWGHGVGLCQIGAAVMGARGYSYKEILMHYFKGTSLDKRY